MRIKNISVQPIYFSDLRIYSFGTGQPILQPQQEAVVFNDDAAKSFQLNDLIDAGQVEILDNQEQPNEGPNQVPEVFTLTTEGTTEKLSGDVVLVAGSGVTIDQDEDENTLTISSDGGVGTVTGSGTIGQIPKWNTTTDLTDSVLLEDAGRIGIGGIPVTLGTGDHRLQAFPAAETGRANISAFTFGDALGSSIAGASANGTKSAPTATVAGDRLMTLSGFGYGTTGYSSAGAAQIRLSADENWTDAAQGTRISFETVTNGGTTRTERMRISNVGTVLIGTTSTLATGGKLQILGGNVGIQNNDGSSSGVSPFTYGLTSGVSSGLFGRGARGTSSVPTAVLSGDTLCIINGRGHDGVGFASTSDGSVAITAAENFSPTAHGTNLRFTVVNPTTLTSNTVMSVGSSSTGAARVGIGTTSPNSRLQVANAALGGINITGSSPALQLESGAFSLGRSTVGNEWGMNEAAGDVVVKNTGGNLFFRGGGTDAILTTSGLGIGVVNTTQVTAQLVLRRQTDSYIQQEWVNPSFADSKAELSLRIGSENFDFWIRTPRPDQDIILLPGAFVGIGTTNPSSKLHVSGDGYFQNNLAIGALPPGATIVGIDAGGENQRAIHTRGFVTIGQLNALTITTDPGYAHITSLADIRIQAGADGLIHLDEGTGNVGIGTTTPGAHLQVVKTNASIQLRDDGSGYAYLDCRAANNSVQEGYFGVEGGSPALIAGGGGLPNAIVMSRIGAYPLQLATNNMARLTIDSAGLVGIGTNAPDAKLHVAGTVKIVDGSQGAGKVFTSDADGLGSWQEPGIRTVKFTKTFSDFSAASTTNTINLVNLPAGAFIIAMKIRRVDSFSGGAVTNSEVRVGDSDFFATDSSIYAGGLEMTAAPDPGPAGQDQNGATTTLSTVNTTQVTTTLVTSGDNIDQLTSGTVDIWLTYVIQS